MGQASIAMLANHPDDKIGSSSHDAAVNSMGLTANLPGSKTVKALLTYGTAQLWREPLLKRDFWQHLQVLRNNSLDTTQ